MKSKRGRSGSPRLGRRRALLGMGGLAASALSGCLGGASSGSSGSPDSDLPCFESSGSKPPKQPLSTPFVGDPNADTTVSVYEDFACPHCKDYALDVFPEIRKKYVEPGKIRYEHHDFPIPVSEPESYTAANAARAAQALAGDEAFWVYSKQLFKNQDALGPEFYGSLADETCLGKNEIRNAATNRKYEKTVMSDRREGIEMGVEGTPTVFVGDKTVEPTVEAISSAIESA